MSATRIRIPDQVEDFFRTAGPGRRRLLALTYRFNSGTFERQFGRVLARGVQVDVVVGDDPPAGGVQYHTWRANWPGTFHPKVLLMLANEQIRVGLGSANLTAGGMGKNLEAWAFFGGRGDASVLVGVRRLLEQLKSRQILPGAIDIDEFIAALQSQKGLPALISTLDGTMLAQVQERLREPIRRLDIVSPLHADPSCTIAALRTFCPRQEFHLYTDAAQVPRIRGIDGYWTLRRPAPRSGNEEIQVVWQAHAKIYAFHCSDYVDLFWGSANLSHRAWTAKGRAANVDILVHSRVPHREWQTFLQALPAGHVWKKTKPRPVTFPTDNVEQGASWRLLHGTLKGGVLVLEATGSGRISLRLRVSKRGQGLKVHLNFAERSAPVGGATTRRLGLQAPQGDLEWSFDKPRAWRTIPVNVLDTVPGEDGEQDAASVLFWRYAGRRLPRATRVGPKSSKRDPPTPEEEELTRSVYQGALDEFVLQWRLVARSIAADSHGNEQLRLHRIREACRMIEAEARSRPAIWPDYRLAFAKELLEREWPK